MHKVKKDAFVCVHLTKTPTLNFLAIRDFDGSLVCHCDKCVDEIDTMGKPNTKNIRLVCEECLIKLLGAKRILESLC